MKTHIRIAVFQADSFQEVEPAFRGVLGADIGLRYSFIKHSPEHRDKFVMEPGYVCLAALCSEHNQVAFDVDIPHWVQIGFRETAPLMPADLKAHPKECLKRFRLLRYALTDQRHFLFRQRGLDFAGDFLEAKLAAWIGGSVTSEYRLFDDKPQDFQFEQGGIMTSRVFTDTFVCALSPVSVGVTVASLKCSWNEYAAFTQEQLQSTPYSKITFLGLKIVGVAFVQEFWNPKFPTLVSADPASAPFIQCPLVDQITGAPGVGAGAVSQASGLPPNIARWCSELNPPEGGILPLVEGGHAVSPSVTP